MATDPEEPTAQSLQSQYAEQFANHLADNREEQARLRKRLEQLKADEAWLVKALETVSAPAEGGVDAQVTEDGSAQPQDSTSTPSEATEPSEAAEVGASATVPKQRQDKPAKARAKKTTAKKTATKKTTAKKPATKQAPAAKKTTTPRAGEPALGELLLAVLGKHAGKPRTASEVAGDLEREYPERARDINTVRNTLERLVAKSRIERMKQKNTVLYTAVPAADNTNDAATETSPATETTGAEKAENTEKVPVQV